MSPGRGPERLRAAGWCAALFLVALALNLHLVGAANSQRLLLGEEASSTFRDPIFLKAHLQHNPFATWWGGNVSFWLGQQLVPPRSLFWGRSWKGFLLALLPALVFLYGRLRLALSAPAAAAAGLLSGIIPLWYGFAWLSGESGLETVLGLGALILLATRRWPLMLAGTALLAFAPLVYAAAWAFVPAAAIEFARGLRGRGAGERLAVAAAAALLAGLVLSLPSLWWTNRMTLFVGGGELLWPPWRLLSRNARALWEGLIVRGGGYYYFSRFPALSNPWLAAAAAAGFLLAARRWRAWWPALLPALSILGICLVAGGEPGIRRVQMLAPLAALTLGGLLDRTAAALAPRFGRRAGRAAATLLFASLAAGPAYQAFALADQLERREIRLALDYPFPIVPGRTMQESVEVFLAAPELLLDGRHVFETDRTLAILHTLAEARGLPAARWFREEDILASWKKNEAFYRSLRPRTSY